MTRYHQTVDHDPKIEWHRREAELFKVQDMYLCPPWIGCHTCNYALPLPEFTPLRPIAGHFAHVSTKDTKLIAYTADAKNGERNIQTTIKPGRYLKRFYKDLSDTVIATLSGMMLLRGSEKDMIEYAETPDEVEEVFTKGPNTCMTKDVKQYESYPIHPTRAFAGPDLKVAYVKNQQTGKIAVRALVWPEKKIFTQVVGDSGTYSLVVRNGLKALGYSEGSIEGARISVIHPLTPTTGRLKFVAPVVDNCNSYHFDRDSGYLVVNRNGKVRPEVYGTGIYVEGY